MAVAKFIEGAVSAQPQSGLVSALYRETGGNPLFLGEAVRLLATERRLSEVTDAGAIRFVVPPGIRDVILRRVRHLGEACVRALTLGSVFGTEFIVEALRRLGEYSAEEVLELVDEAVRSGLLSEVPGALGRHRFSHGLVRETLYEDLSPGERARLHRRAGEVLVGIYGSDAEVHLAELAHHFFEAARGGDAGRAAEFARRAADQAVRSLAYEEAARLYHMALQAFELEGSTDGVLHADLLLALGDARGRAGDLSSASEAFLRAAGIARRTGEATQLARAALGYGGRFVWTRAGSDRHIIPLLQDALVLLGGNDDRLRIRLLARLACALRDSPDREHTDALSRQAVELARQLNDLPTLGYALVGRAWATFWRRRSSRSGSS